MKYFTLFVLFFFLFVNCSHYNSRVKQSELVMLQITDCNNISEIISSKEKIKKMAKIDYLSPQPYKKVLRIFENKKNTKNFSIITSYHSNGNLFQFLEVEKNRAKGYYREWFANGTKKIEAYVIGGPADLSFSSQKKWLFDKICLAWDEKGNLVSQISYNQGILEGNSYYYYPNGSLQKIIPFNNGKIHGDVLENNEEGKLFSKNHFENGKLQGPSFGYWETSQIQFVEEYDQGKLLEAQYFDKTNHLVAFIKKRKGKKATFKNGFLHSLIEYREGIAEGKVKTFSADGQLLSRYFSKNGKKQGEEIFFFQQEELEIDGSTTMQKRTPKLSLFWDEGVLHGIVKTWHNNGQLESQRQMGNNKKNGSNCAWYRDGSLMLIEEYEEDLLLKGRYYKPNCNIPVSSIDNGSGEASLYDEKGILLRKIKYYKGKPTETY